MTHELGVVVDETGTVAEQIAGELISRGISHGFGLVGSGNFYVTNALVRRGMRFVGGRHEGSSVAAADAYSRVSGELVLCSVSTGPGLTNTITSLGEAAKARTPMIVLAGDVPGRAVRNNFRVDQHGAVEAVGAIAERVHSAASAVADIDRAVRRALRESKPVVVMLPTDVQEATAHGSPHARPQREPNPLYPDPVDIQAAASALAGAERPLIVAGHGAVAGNNAPGIRRIAARVGALITNTVLAKDICADDEYSVGISGGFSTPLAVELLPQADVVLVLGASLTYWTTRHNTLYSSDACFIQVDSDPVRIGQSQPVDVPIVADVTAVVTALEAQLAADGVNQVGWRTPEVARSISERGRWHQIAYEDHAGETIDPRTLSLELNRLLPADRAVVVDSGHFLGYPAMYLDVQDPTAFVFPNAFQSVGLGLGAAVGAAVARGGRLTVVAVGDGGALMALGELETIAQNQFPVLIVVYNDAWAGAEAHHFGPQGEDLALVSFPDVDFAATAIGLGIPAITVRSTADLDPLTRWTAELRGPMLIDAKIDRSVSAHWLEEAFRGEAH